MPTRMVGMMIISYCCSRTTGQEIKQGEERLQKNPNPTSTQLPLPTSPQLLIHEMTIPSFFPFTSIQWNHYWEQLSNQKPQCPHISVYQVCSVSYLSFFLLRWCRMKDVASGSLFGTWPSSKTMTPSAHSFMDTVFISTSSQLIFLLESMQTLVSVILESEDRHLWWLPLPHSLSLRLHSSSIRAMPLSSPRPHSCPLLCLALRECTEHHWE